MVAAMALTCAPGVAGQKTPGRVSDPPAVTYRKAVMDGLVAHLIALRTLLANDLGYAGDVRKHSAALLANAMMLDGVFAPGSTGGTTKAKEDIWANSAEFKAHLKSFQEAVRMVDQDVGRDSGATVIVPHLQMVVQECGGCHSEFKLTAPLPF